MDPIIVESTRFGYRRELMNRTIVPSKDDIQSDSRSTVAASISNIGSSSTVCTVVVVIRNAMIISRESGRE